MRCQATGLAGAGPDILFGLCLERNLGMVIGILILKARRGICPFDLSIRGTLRSC